MKASLSMSDIAAIKAELGRRLPNVKSSHRVEAMARGLGWKTNAALRAVLASGQTEYEISDKAFFVYLASHGFTGVSPTTLADAMGCVFTDVSARDAILAVLAKEPSLIQRGFYVWSRKEVIDLDEEREAMFDASFVDQFKRSCEFLAPAIRRVKINKSRSSYGYKHDAERMFRDRGLDDAYICKGALIAAAIHLGFRYKKNLANAHFNIAAMTQEDLLQRKRASSSPLAVRVGGKLHEAAWRNMIIAAINAAMEQGLFGLEPGDNRWPGHDTGSQAPCIFRFDFFGEPAIAAVSDIGHGELSLHVALRPTPNAERYITSYNAGFLAGDAFAHGDLERKDGKWIQTPGKPTTKFRRSILPMVAASQVTPKGFLGEGPFMM